MKGDGFMNSLLREMKRNLKKIYLKQVRRKRAEKKSGIPLKFSYDDLPEQFHQQGRIHSGRAANSKSLWSQKVASLDWVPEPYRSQIRSAKPVKVIRPRAVRKKRKTVTLH
jgi:hypothetical protein